MQLTKWQAVSLPVLGTQAFVAAESEGGMVGILNGVCFLGL